MQGFRRLVTAVGGVTLNVRDRIPIGRTGDITGYIEPGKRRLNGFETLWFARSRADADDYSRMARQKCVLNAMLQQLSPKTVVLKFEKIAKASEALITTDLPQGEVDRFMELALKARSQPIRTVSFVPPMVYTGEPRHRQDPRGRGEGRRPARESKPAGRRSPRRAQRHGVRPVARSATSRRGTPRTRPTTSPTSADEPEPSRSGGRSVGSPRCPSPPLQPRGSSRSWSPTTGVTRSPGSSRRWTRPGWCPPRSSWSVNASTDGTAAALKALRDHADLAHGAGAGREHRWSRRVPRGTGRGARARRRPGVADGRRRHAGARLPRGLAPARRTRTTSWARRSSPRTTGPAVLPDPRPGAARGSCATSPSWRRRPPRGLLEGIVIPFNGVLLTRELVERDRAAAQGVLHLGRRRRVPLAGPEGRRAHRHGRRVPVPAPVHRRPRHAADVRAYDVQPLALGPQALLHVPQQRRQPAGRTGAASACWRSWSRPSGSTRFTRPDLRRLRLSARRCAPAGGATSPDTGGSSMADRFSSGGPGAAAPATASRS